MSLPLASCIGENGEPDVPGPRSPPSPPQACPTTPGASDFRALLASEAAKAKSEAAHAAPPAAHAAHAHWSYSGEEGPEKWGDLSPDYAPCKKGTHQSPIDIVTKTAEVDKALEPLGFEYKSPLALQIWNNGHTVQVQGAASEKLKAGGGEWKLAQFHFHSPSEHAIDGKLLDLEMHLVHTNEKGELSVVGLLFKKGKENKALSEVFEHAPADVAKEASPVKDASIELEKVLPKDATYYAYDGSLTTPKCSEGVHWYVLSSLSEISEEQLQRFRKVVHGDTNRPVQPLGARKIRKTH